MNLEPEAEARLLELGKIMRAQATRLCRIGRIGTITVEISVDGRTGHIETDARVVVEERPLLGESRRRGRKPAK